MTGSTAESVATTGTAAGIEANAVEACYGDGRVGIRATNGTVANSAAFGNGLAGIEAAVVTGSHGSSHGATTPGISATRAAMNSYGRNISGGDGLSAPTGVVTNCFGEAAGAGIGLRALTANGSRGEKAGAVSQLITNKFNMP